MRKIKFLVAAIMFVLVLTLLSGCSSGGKKKIVFVMQQLNNGAFWDALDAKIRERTESEGYEYELAAPEVWGAENQAEVINDVVKKGTDVLIIAPCGTSQLFEAIKRANEKGIKVIVIDTDMDREYLASYGAKIDTFVGIDNYECGRQVGNLVAAKLEKGSEFVVFSGGIDSINSEERSDGFQDAMEEQGMTCVARNAISWTAEDAYARAKQVFQAYPDIKGVFSVNSTVHQGVYKAAQEFGIKAEYGAFDTDDAILQQIENGEVVCTLDQNSTAVSEKVVEAAGQLLSGKKVEAVITSEGKMISKQ